MNDAPLVSVVVIFLDAERFLREAIESVLAQTFEYWELLLVDDGSTDESSAIARGFSETHADKIRYLEHPGRNTRGMSASRNLGIRESKGEFVAFLDADDVWLDSTLADQVAIMRDQPEAAMVYGPLSWWYSWTGRPEDRVRDYIEELGLPADTLIAPPAILPLFLLDKAAVPSGMLVRRTAIERVGGFEDEFEGEYEDQVFCAKVCLHLPVFVSSRSWYRYRQHSDSAVAVGLRTGETRNARLVFLEWMAGYVRSQAIDDRAVLQAVRHELRRAKYASTYRTISRMRDSSGRITRSLRGLIGSMLPATVRAKIWARMQGEAYVPPPGRIRLGDLRRVTPIDRDFGYGRGSPVDRHYIGKFLAAHQADIRGRVLEIADDNYTREFGGASVTKGDILHVTPGDPAATIIGDLTNADHIPADSFDCIILTQTLQVIYDVPAVVRTTHRILKPGGVALVTAPGISPISRYDMDRWGYYWGFTSLSLRRLFSATFGDEGVTTGSYGNVLTATAFLYGIAAEELLTHELDHSDPDFEVTIGVRAKKAPSDGSGSDSSA